MPERIILQAIAGDMRRNCARSAGEHLGTVGFQLREGRFSSRSVVRVVAACYAAGLLTVAALGSRHRFTYLHDEYSIAEALLWLGIYLAINLQLSSVDLLAQWRDGPRTTA